jgi:hypothetical protein
MKDDLVDLGIDGKMILKCIQRMGIGVETASIHIRMETT